MVAANKGEEAVYFRAGTTLGTVAPIGDEEIVDRENWAAQYLGDSAVAHRHAEEGAQRRGENRQCPEVATLVASPTDHTGHRRRDGDVVGRLTGQGKDLKCGGEGVGGAGGQGGRGGDEDLRDVIGDQVAGEGRDQPNGGPSRPRWHPPETPRREQLLDQLDPDLAQLTPLEQTQLREHLLSYMDVFAIDTTELGSTDLTQHRIKTRDHPPIKQPPRRIPFALRQTVDELIDSMLTQGVVIPSASPWASPIVLVRKKDGGTRFCVDYRKLNHITKLDEFPLPRIDETLDLLAGARYFTTLDLASGYWQVPMEPTSQEKTAFVTHCGLYEFTKMPFGLVNAPATFQRLMELVLSGLARDKCHIYLDDILVFGRTLSEHNQNLSLVLTRIRKARLKLKPKK